MLYCKRRAAHPQRPAGCASAAPGSLPHHFHEAPNVEAPWKEYGSFQWDSTIISVDGDVDSAARELVRVATKLAMASATPSYATLEIPAPNSKPESTQQKPCQEDIAWWPF